MTLAVSINSLIALTGGLAAGSYFLFLAWMAIDALKTGRILWLIAILGVPFIGVVIYFFVEKEHDYMKLREKGEAK